VRSAQERLGRPIAVLADLCGPKIRVAGLEQPVQVAAGDMLVLAEPGKAAGGAIGVTFPGLAEVVEPGQPVLIDDGRVRARAEARDGARLLCVVEVGGTIAPAKGVNLPATTLPIPALTEKDEADLEFALASNVDYVALSFVRSPEDVAELRRRIDDARSPARIVVKIEKAEAVANLDAILELCDAAMVARGDLGVEIGVSQVPLVQKRIIKRARELGRAVITATQMLESMIHEAEPTRAEASDVANAILDGTSAVMLSAETAAGDHPLRAVAVMDTIARSVEPSLPYEREAASAEDIGRILTHAACDLADDVGAAVIAVSTETGRTARQVSRCRPQRPIVAAATSPTVLRQLALEWAVVPVAVGEATTFDDGWDAILDEVEEQALAGVGDTVVMTGRADAPFGSTTHVSVHRIGEER
jgi:pyruvate kinase